jgi:UDP-N-acetyl-D-glucosamine dehydrogenase
MNVVIVGLGYVGLPLALQFCRSGLHVTGLDIDANKVASLLRGESYLRHIPGEVIAEQVASGRFVATRDFSAVRDADSIVICVPTPLRKNREPDLSFVLETGRSLAPYLKRGALVVLESTSYPGTTDEDLRAVLESGSGMCAGADFHLAFSPEREDPGNPLSDVAKIPKIVGGLTPRCLEKACALYGSAVENLVPVSSCKAAEAAKLLENIFRSVNIALVNELKLVYAAMGIDIWEVVAAASTKPFGFMPFSPGPGIGGHCIPVDPFYLTWKAREFGFSTRFIELAGEINESMPAHVVRRTGEALNASRKAINGSRIIVVGLAYKPEVDDIRETPSFHVMNLLKAQGATVDYYDPYVPTIGRTRENPAWAGQRSVAWNETTFRSADAVVIATAHRALDYRELLAWSPCIIDTRNAIRAHLGNEVPAEFSNRLWLA